jgi:uncharacterized protein YggE
MKDWKQYLNKIKIAAIILGGFSLVFLLALLISDSKDSAHIDVVSVIGVAEEAIHKDAQFDLDYITYGITQADAEKQIDDKISEISTVMGGLDDKLINGEAKKTVVNECMLDTRYRYPKQFSETGECLSNNWRAQARITMTIEGNKYSEDLKKRFLGLAPGTVNAVSGPTFIKQEINEDLEDRLLGSAMNNAKNKAEKMAKESDKKLGEVVEIDENPLVKNNFLDIQSEEVKSLNPGEDIIKKEILVKYRLK